MEYKSHEYYRNKIYQIMKSRKNFLSLWAYNDIVSLSSVHYLGVLMAMLKMFPEHFPTSQCREPPINESFWQAGRKVNWSDTMVTDHNVQQTAILFCKKETKIQLHYICNGVSNCNWHVNYCILIVLLHTCQNIREYAKLSLHAIAVQHLGEIKIWFPITS